jgi:diguanylate cyclase (GGDEF)-like protein
MAIPWAEKKRAVIAWSSRQKTEDIVERIMGFEKEAISLVENINRYEKVEELSYTDGLTGMYNFRYFQKRIHEELQRAKRYNRYVALLIFDIDDLKAVNDRWGHLAGDSLIKNFGRALTALVRSNDIVSRYGGDEFCLIMPETDHKDAELFMERIRGRIAAGNSFLEWADERLEYTVSTGGAVYPADAQSVDSLIHAADMALLRAKSEGRNCSKMYQPEYNQKI